MAGGTNPGAYPLQALTNSRPKGVIIKLPLRSRMQPWWINEAHYALAYHQAKLADS